MQPRATFKSVKTDDPDLFVIAVEGHLGLRQKAMVEDLVRRCRENGKQKVVFDFTALESLAGSVASTLGTFAAEMAVGRHPVWFVGASPVVQTFLTARFTESAPCFADDLEAARGKIASGVQPTKVGAKEEVTEARPESSYDDDLESMLEAEIASEPEVVPPPAETGPPRRAAHLTLVDAQPLIAEVADLAAAKPVLEGLLAGSDLAAHSALYCLRGDRLLRIDDEGRDTRDWLPANGAISTLLRRRGTPVDLVDVGEEELDGHETEVLTELNCQIGVPVFVDAQLAGIVFARKQQAGDEYLPSEVLALDLLARQVGLWLSRGDGENAETEAEKQLKLQVRRLRTVLRLAHDFNGIEDEERMLTRLLISLIAELGVGGAVYFAIEGDALVPRHTYGIDDGILGIYTLREPEALAVQAEMVAPREADPQVWGEAAQQLAKSGIDLLVPFRGRGELLAIIGLNARRAKESGRFDPDYLESILHQAALATERLRGMRGMEQQTLRVAQTLVALVEKRLGRGSMTNTELITWYVSRLAERLNFDQDHRSDLLYGTVLRDIGMIEISDLVLKSPRALTPEEWKLIQRHPISGVDILRSMEFSDVTCDVVLHHHERFNGEGYPHGLRGTAIPLGARIVAVVESYVAMTHDTPYRPALSRSEALSVLRENWEMRYDPSVIAAFTEIVECEPDPSVEHAVEALLAASVGVN